MISPNIVAMTIRVVNESVAIMSLIASICCFCCEDIDDPCAESIAELMLILIRPMRGSANARKKDKI